MTRSHLLLSLAIALGWTLEQETEGRVQVRHGQDDPDAPRLDYEMAQVDADDAGEAGNILFTTLLDKLRHPHGKDTSPPIPSDPLSTDTKAICKALDKLTAAQRDGNRVASDVSDVVGEMVTSFMGLLQDDPKAPIAARPGGPGDDAGFGVLAQAAAGYVARPSDLLQVNQAVLALIQRQTEAEERIYGRFCDMVERSIDKVTNAVLQGQSVQLAHEQWMKQAEQSGATSDKIDTQLGAFSLVLERFAAVAEENNKLARERMEAGKAQAEMIAKMTSGTPTQANAPTPSGGFA